jgi:excinuclease ABC subunit C
LYALDHINDIALLKHAPNGASGGTGKRSFRFEAYDIAHMAGTHVVGAFVVSENGQLNPSQYRKFIISKQTNNDLAGLAEVLNRRLNHSEWPYPDLIIVDGNETHRTHAENVLKARRITIPIIAVTKDDKHRAARLIGHPDMIKQYQKEVIALNAEAHRFVIAYHRNKRALKR